MLGGRSPRISAAARVLEGLAALLSRVESCFPGCASADRPAFHRIAGASEFQHLPAGLSAEIASKCTSLFAVGSIARPLAMHPVDDGLGIGSLKGFLEVARRQLGTCAYEFAAICKDGADRVGKLWRRRRTNRRLNLLIRPEAPRSNHAHQDGAGDRSQRDATGFSAGHESIPLLLRRRFSVRAGDRELSHR